MTAGATDIFVTPLLMSQMGFFLAEPEHLGKTLFFLGGILTSVSCVHDIEDYDGRPTLLEERPGIWEQRERVNEQRIDGVQIRRQIALDRRREIGSGPTAKVPEVVTVQVPSTHESK